jgi:hypothetical protein
MDNDDVLLAMIALSVTASRADRRTFTLTSRSSTTASTISSHGAKEAGSVAMSSRAVASSRCPAVSFPFWTSRS